MATACAGPAAQGARVSYTCCSASVTAPSWHPGQQLPVTWTRVGNVPTGQSIQPVTLSAVMTGPFSSATALKAAINQGRGGSVTARAANITISRNPPRTPVSVITIPANAPPGFYDLEFTMTLGLGGGSASGESIVTVG
jgi:hypothetical protein